MKINSIVLKNALKPIIGLAQLNATIPALENLRITLNNGKIHLITANQETMAFTELSTAEMGEGDYLIDATLLNNFLNNIENKELDFSFEDEIVTIKYKGGKVKLPYLSGDNFIKPPKHEYSDSIIVQSETFLDSLNKAVKFSANHDLRVALNGVYIEKSHNGMTLVATDAHKMCVVDIDGDFPDFKEVIIPKSIINLTNGVKGEVVINLSDRNIKMKIGDYTFISRLIDAKFPNFKALIPENNNKAIIDKNLLSSGVKRLLVTSNKLTNVGVFDFKGEELEILSEDLDYNRSIKETLPVKSDLPIKIGFNLRFLTTILSALKEDTVDIRLSEPNRGIVFKENNTTLLLMPVNIQ